MAATYTPYQAFDYCKIYIKAMPLERVQSKILDYANKALWMAANWRWTVGTLTATTLLSSTQDYTITDPADFNYLIHSYIADGVAPVRHLEVVSALPAAVTINGNPDFIAHTTNLLRVSPNPGTLPVSPTRQILSWYKKNPPNITPSNVGTAGVLLMDDAWFWVYSELVLYYAFKYAEDQRAGSANLSSEGKWQYTGQLAIANAAIEQMKQREPLMTFQQRMALQDTKS